MSKGWDNATLKKLKALTCKGLSTSEIGKRLGMSKNAIVGKLNRLGWNAKAGGAAAAEVKEVATKKKATKTTTTAKVTKKTAGVTKNVATKKAAVAPKKATAKTTVKQTGKKTVQGAPKAQVVKNTVTNNGKSNKAKPVAKQMATKTATKSSAKNLAVHQRIIQHSLEMANLKPNQCRWPIGDPDSEHFHFCGENVFVGKPYCYEHCKQAYQFAPIKKK